MTDAKQALEVVERLRASGVPARYGRKPSWVSRSEDDAKLMQQAASLLSSLAEENERLRGEVTRWKDVSASAIKCLATATDMLEILSPHPMMTAGFAQATRELRRIGRDLSPTKGADDGK